MMKRRINFDTVKIRKSSRRPRLTEGIYGSALVYLKFVCIWGVIMAADYLLEFRFEFLWPFWLLLGSICDSFKYQGLLFSIFFVLIAFITDLTCYILLPVHWLFFAASSYVWIQYVWHTERGLCLGTVVLWVLFVWLEASLRLREIKTIDLCRPFAAHCIGYPMVTLGFGFKTYLAYKWRLRKQKDVRKVNEMYIQLINQALPLEVQQEAEKERLIREKGAFSENTEDASQSNVDSSSSSSLSTTNGNSNNSTILPSNSTFNHCQAQLNPPNSSSICTVSKRSSKSNHSDSSVSANTIVQTAAARNQTKIPTTTTASGASAATTNGHDDGLSSKQQKKQQNKSANTQPTVNNTTQSRRQTKKQEQVQETSRDSSSSHINGFTTTSTIDNSDIEKDLQIHKLEADIQKLSQTLERQKASENQMKSQLTELRSIRKDYESLMEENEDLKSKYESNNAQKQRDKQRLVDLERNLNEERQNKQRLESQIKTEKALTKKLQDDLIKISSIPVKNECAEQCLKRKRDFENETREFRRLHLAKDEQIKILENEINALKYRDPQNETEMLRQHISQLCERNSQLQENLSAETRIKLDLFSALGDVRRQLEIANGAIREKERELQVALQSQHQANNCLFNGHPNSYCSTSSGHSSPTHQLIDTNNNPTTTSTSGRLYSPTAMTLSSSLTNASSSLDPNAQDFCLATHSTTNN